jgi:hypothetical protein
MKRVLGIGMCVALASFFAACDSSNEKGKDVPTTFDNGGDKDVVGDTGTDVDRDVVQVDPGHDQQTQDNVVVDTVTPDTGVDTNGTDTPTVVCDADKPGSCKNVSLCIFDCPIVSGQYDPTCRAECEGQLDAVGMQVYGDYNTCIQANCSTATTQEEYSDCIFSKCINQYYACYSGCNVATCADLQACIISCPDDDPATTSVDEFSVCWDDCTMNATADAQIDRSDLMACIRTTCPTCATQANQTEIDECNTCYGTAISTGGACVAEKNVCSKYETCGDVFKCMNACAETDDACFSVCYSLGSSQAATDYEARGDCVRTNCPTCATQANQTEIDECNTCFQGVVSGACKTQVEACVAWGTDSCATALACVNGGGSNCFDNITQQGATLWDDMIGCATDSCTAQCPDNPTTEQETACNDCINAALNTGGACNDKLLACGADQ